MAEKPQYDDDNRGAGWPTKAVRGTLKVGGKVFYHDTVQTGLSAPRPVYNLYATGAESHILYGCALFTPKRADSKSKGAGVLDLGKEGGEYWINLFVNATDAANPNRPVVRLTAQAKDPEPVPRQAPTGGDEPAYDPGADGGYDPKNPDQIPF